MIAGPRDGRHGAELEAGYSLRKHGIGGIGERPGRQRPVMAAGTMEAKGDTMNGQLAQILAIGAGALMIVVAAVLAFRQSMSWQLVVVFCLGAVLSGVSGVTIQSQDLSVKIGQVALATQNTNSSSQQQNAALTIVTNRLNQLDQEVSALQTQQTHLTGQIPATPPPQAFTAQRLELNRLLSQSRAFSLRSSSLSAPLAQQAPGN